MTSRWEASKRLGLGPMVMAEPIGTLAGGRYVELDQLFDVFGIKRGNWRGFAHRLASGRWPRVVVVDTPPGKRGGRRKEKRLVGKDLALIEEVAKTQRNHGIKGIVAAIDMIVRGGKPIPAQRLTRHKEMVEALRAEYYRARKGLRESKYE
jgi:hypothetical protein